MPARRAPSRARGCFLQLPWNVQREKADHPVVPRPDRKKSVRLRAWRGLADAGPPSHDSAGVRREDAEDPYREGYRAGQEAKARELHGGTRRMSLPCRRSEERRVGKE